MLIDPHALSNLPSLRLPAAGVGLPLEVIPVARAYMSWFRALPLRLPRRARLCNAERADGAADNPDPSI